MSLIADVIVIGSGPGGASVARGLARAGKQVILLERGRDWRKSPLYGTYPGALLYADRASLLFTQEGLNIIRPMMAGGATSMYCGCAARPPSWIKDRYGLNLDPYADETIAELNIAPLPESLRGAASTHLAATGTDLGYNWEPMPKFMSPARAHPFDCGATCMLGCRCGAKWNAAEWVDEAVATGNCRFVTSAKVERILIENRKVVGVQARIDGQSTIINAPIVVLAAGGIGSPVLLKQAGLAQAGNGVGMDTTVMVYGAAKRNGNGNEPPMTYEWKNDEQGYLLSTLIDPWLNYPIMMMLKSPRYLPSWARWNQTLGMMIKLKDDLTGCVSSERDIQKPLSAADQKKLDHALEVANKILVKAGADPQTLMVTPMRGTHPCATVRIGPNGMLDNNLQTEIENLYVCDASALPETLARPTVLTILSMGKRLVKHLIPSEPSNQTTTS
jgi:choline dehydrogenase-like flavoprotein